MAGLGFASGLRLAGGWADGRGKGLVEALLGEAEERAADEPIALGGGHRPTVGFECSGLELVVPKCGEAGELPLALRGDAWGCDAELAVALGDLQVVAPLRIRSGPPRALLVVEHAAPSGNPRGDPRGLVFANGAPLESLTARAVDLYGYPATTIARPKLLITTRPPGLLHLADGLKKCPDGRFEVLLPFSGEVSKDRISAHAHTVTHAPYLRFPSRVSLFERRPAPLQRGGTSCLFCSRSKALGQKCP